jgi:hypothetical protein|tara:strand:+ start:183 stop:1052 length:870 start_codon:yes stop_codon:yes gene_type:complete
MDFIKELHEARLTRGSGALKSLTYTDCCERAYLTMLILEVLRRFPNTAPYAHGYAKKTAGADNYKHFRMSSTDLYNFVYFIEGDEDAHSKLKDPGAAKRLSATTHFPLMAFNRYVHALGNATASSSRDQQTFINIESALKITNTDYKGIRRNVFSFVSISADSKKKLVTRLLLAARAKLRSSDIIEYLEKLSAERDLEVYRITDPEPKVSVPDINVTGQDLAVYARLVGSKNLMLTKKFLELAKDGKSIPASVVQAYLPAIVMLDNIVKGGPSFISLLRTLENRAQNTR